MSWLQMEGNTERDFKRATQKERAKRQNPERGGVPQGSCAGLVGGSLTILVPPFSVLSLLHPSGTQASCLVCSRRIGKLKMLTTPHICLFQMSYMCSKTHLYTMYSFEIKRTRTEALTSPGRTSGLLAFFPATPCRAHTWVQRPWRGQLAPLYPLFVSCFRVHDFHRKRRICCQKEVRNSSRTSQTFSLFVRASPPCLLCSRSPDRLSLSLFQKYGGLLRLGYTFAF